MAVIKSPPSSFSGESSRQPPQPQPTLPPPELHKLIQKGRARDIIMGLLTSNFFFLIAFGSNHSLESMTMHLSHIAIILVALLHNPELIAEDKFQMILFIASSAVSSIMILSTFSTVSASVSLFAWILVFLIVFSPIKMQDLVNNIKSFFKSVAAMLLVVILGAFLVAVVSMGVSLKVKDME